MYFVWRYIFPILFAYQGLADDVANTMEYYTPYQHLRICAQSVFSPSAIVSVIGCPSPWYNGCYCRGMSDFSVIITSYISSFINSACSSNQVDVSSVFSVYDGYCEGAGYLHPAANNAATTTLQGSIGAPTSTVLVITTATATATSSSGVNSAATREYHPSLAFLGFAVFLPVLVFEALR